MIVESSHPAVTDESGRSVWFSEVLPINLVVNKSIDLRVINKRRTAVILK